MVPRQWYRLTEWLARTSIATADLLSFFLLGRRMWGEAVQRGAGGGGAVFA